MDAKELSSKRAEAGKLGGIANISKNGKERMKEIAQKGGLATKAKYGVEHYKNIRWHKTSS